MNLRVYSYYNDSSGGCGRRRISKQIMGKKILVIGATGAMGQYLVPALAEMDVEIDAISLDEKESTQPNVRYYKANARERATLMGFLKNHYDCIVDFMTYPTNTLATMMPLMTSFTDQYIYLSSCRVFANEENPIVESSPRLIDASKDAILVNSDDYCIYKARGENILRSLPRKNWTIVRPSTTYSYLRYQLVTLEAADTVGRAFAGKPVALPEQARLIPASLCWGGDVAKMFKGLIFNEKALGEDFNVTTSEARTWEEIADYYKEICGLKAVWIDKEDYLSILETDPCNLGRRWQLEVARLFNRVYDNSKMLAATGLKQSDFIPLRKGLEYEISRCPKDYPFKNNERMDAFFAKH